MRSEPTAARWARLRERLRALERSLEGEAHASPEEMKERLEERARRLARPVDPLRLEHLPEVVLFELAGERYAVDAGFVLEVYHPGDRVPLPAAEPPVHGITAWRGDLLPLVDLRALLGQGAAPLPDHGPVIVLGRDERSFGVPVDRVVEIRELAPDSLSPAPAGRALLRGLTADAVLVLDADQLGHTLT